MSENGWRWCAASSARYSALVRCAGAALAYSGATSAMSSVRYVTWIS
ncbi:hypothetical protein Y023_4649 [Burkholderia pseudomallei A79D]|nr:hypothetical protein Y023_4649 [Burkholderia pseudomallei A79D]